MATWLFDKTLGISLTKKRSNSRLLSYHFLKEQEISSVELKQYIETGRLNPVKSKRK